MKNKWGIGITIFYLSFVAVMVSFVIFSRGQNIDLVRDDYYQGDIEFQSKYNKLSNASKLKKDLWVELDKSTKAVKLEFPSEIRDIDGHISFYKPDNKTLDFKLPIRLDNDNKQEVSMAVRSKGVWKISVDWKGDGTEYFKNDEIYY